LEWRVYSRTGRVFGAVLRIPSVVHTDQGLIEADAGDYVIVDDEVSRIRHIPAEYFPRVFRRVERTIPLRTLAGLSAMAVSRVKEVDGETAGAECSHCGARHTDRVFEGAATCSACELAIRAGREERLECRHDGAQMEKEVLEDLIVDRCPKCGGVWLDGGELEVLGAAIQRAASPGSSPGMASRLLHSLVRGRAE
jgi:hypothetical protein